MDEKSSCIQHSGRWPYESYAPGSTESLKKVSGTEIAPNNRKRGCLKWNKSDKNGEQQTKEGETPDIQSAGLDVVPDRYIRHACAQVHGSRHGADERGA